MNLQELKENESLLTTVRAVKGGKIQFEIAEKITTEVLGSNNVLAMFNQSDERFEGGSKPRRAWMTAEKTDFCNIIDLSNDVERQVNSLEEGDTIELNIKNPVIKGTNKRLVVKVQETTEGTDYQMANVETTAKRAGKDGPILKHNNKPIFGNTKVDAVSPGVKVDHTFLPHDTEEVEVTSEEEAAAGTEVSGLS